VFDRCLCVVTSVRLYVVEHVPDTGLARDAVDVLCRCSQYRQQMQSFRLDHVMN
jgi:hypothetical protein